MRITRRKHKLKKGGGIVEIIDFHPSEIQFIINKLYHVHNKPDICIICGKPSSFIRLEVYDFTKIRSYKICRTCLMGRR
jgi:hypothetical protein